MKQYLNLHIEKIKLFYPNLTILEYNCFLDCIRYIRSMLPINEKIAYQFVKNLNCKNKFEDELIQKIHLTNIFLEKDDKEKTQIYLTGEKYPVTLCELVDRFYAQKCFVRSVEIPELMRVQYHYTIEKMNEFIDFVNDFIPKHNHCILK